MTDYSDWRNSFAESSDRYSTPGSIYLKPPDYFWPAHSFVRTNLSRSCYPHTAKSLSIALNRSITGCSYLHASGGTNTS